MMLPDMLSGLIAIDTGAKGPNFAISSACATAGHTLGEATEIIRRGDAKVMIAGGAEAPITRIGLAAFDAMRALSRRNDDPERASRPFDLDRDGFVLSEAAGILILESLEHAQARKARIYAELVGYGATADAHHITAPSEGGEGAARAMRLALKQAGLEPSDIGYVNAHGTSTKLGDTAEALAIRAVFGDGGPPVSSSKAVTGHMLGASGVLEAAACVMAVGHGLLPPTHNLDDPDPACELDHVRGGPRSVGVSVAMSNSFGFGGHNVSLAIGKPTTRASRFA
jgi:3-oxoacyl-[acyl-carrier-protein] synthase II